MRAPPSSDTSWDDTKGQLWSRTNSVLIVALGIGATTAAFSVTDFVLIRPQAYPEPDRLVKLWERMPGYTRMELSPANYRDWKKAATSFESMGTYHAEAVTLLGRAEPLRGWPASNPRTRPRWPRPLVCRC